MTTLQIKLSERAEREFIKRAAATGRDVNALVEEAVEAAAVTPTPTWDEVLRPMRQAIAASGMSEDQLLAFFENERQAMRDEERRQIETPSENG